MSDRNLGQRIVYGVCSGLRILDLGHWTGVLLLVLLGSSSVLGQTPAEAFSAANKLYYENKFNEAAAAYEKLIQLRKGSVAVYFNLGNAWFKSGQLGRAIAAYRQAEKLSPRDPDIRANLQFARNQAQGPTFVSNRWFQWLRKLTLNEWTILAAGALWLSLLLFTAVQYRPAWKGHLRGWLILTTVGTAILCGCLGLALRRAYSSPIAIITHDAVVQEGPVEGSPTAFAVHDGAELRVVDEKDEWLLVSTDARRLGWVRRDQVLLAPPI